MQRPKIRANKLNHNPLFIKILNWKGDRYAIENILDDLANSFEDEKDKSAVVARRQDLNDSYLQGLSDYQARFRQYILQAVQSQNISEEFLFWLNNAFKYVGESVETYAKDETRKVYIKEPSGRWLEGLSCYSFIMALNYFGLDIIKVCPVCASFFSHKGQYARYCNEACKSLGMKKRTPLGKSP